MIKSKMRNKIAILGMGYVGFPLLQSFSKKYYVSGYDINKNKILFLKKNIKNIILHITKMIYQILIFI